MWGQEQASPGPHSGRRAEESLPRADLVPWEGPHTGLEPWPLPSVLAEKMGVGVGGNSTSSSPPASGT